jgi:hypothetical protein
VWILSAGADLAGKGNAVGLPSTDAGSWITMM